MAWYAEGPLAGASGDQAIYYLDVPSGTSFLTVIMYPGASSSGDADLYVQFGSAPTDSSYDCAPYAGGDAEACTFAKPQAGRWYVMAEGYSAYSDVNLLVGVYASLAGSGSALQQDVPIGPFSGASASDTQFTVDVPPGVSKLVVSLGATSSATGDADLFVRYGAPADSTTFDWSSVFGGTSDALIVPVSQPGKYYLSAHGYSSYTKAYVVASFLP